MAGVIHLAGPDGSVLDPQPVPADAIKVGKVADAWGVHGAVKIYPYSADPQALLASRKWYLSPSTQAPHAFDSTGLVRAKDVKRHGTFVVARFDGVTDRDVAASFRGAEISVPRSSFPSAGPDEFYWVDLIGLQVVNLEGVDFGWVDDLMSNGPQTVLVVHLKRPDGSIHERLIPFVSVYIIEVDKEARRIRVDWQADY